MDERDYFYRDAWVEIDLDCIAANVSAVKKRLPEGTELIAVVKANGYGHGDVQAAQTALRSGASMLAVAFLDEALSLRKKGIRAPILVLGVCRPEDVNVAAREEIILTVAEKAWLEKAAGVLQEDEHLKFHVKLDTGMGRLGIRDGEELAALEAFARQDHRLLIEGVFTHFATADEKDSDYFHQQADKFNQLLTCMAQPPAFIHCSNSAAALRYPDTMFNAVRLGIAMYGLSPSLEIKPDLPVELKEAYSLHARLTQVKKVKKGDKISYGSVYEAESDQWIGTIPIGYADGWIRRLQGQEVLINGQRAPIVGRICMDQCMVRLPQEVPAGSLVTLIGSQGNETVSVDEIACRLETINYEITCQISPRVPRVYKQSGRTIGVNNPVLQANKLS